jgi:hypothetical protein
MGWPSTSSWDVYSYGYVAGVVTTCFGVFAKNGWLSYLRYRDGSQPSPPAARTLLIVTGVGLILMAYYFRSHGD